MKFFRSLSVSLSLSRALKKSSKNAQRREKEQSLNFLSLSVLRFRCCVVLLETRRCFTRENFIFAIVFLFFFGAKNSPFLVEKDARFEGF